MATLTLHDIRKDYPGRRVLRKLNLQFSAGATALLGPNGAGKSTLLSILATRRGPSSGHFALDQLDSEKQLPALRQQIGVVGHSGFLYLDLSLEENLLLFARLHHVAEPSRRVEEVAAQFRLQTRLEQPVGELSRGLLQRAALARATLHEPQVLLLDEPFTGLDPVSSDLLTDLIQTWRDAGRMLIFATHDLNRAAQSADRFLILHRGKVADDFAGPTDGPALLQRFREATSRKS